MAHEYLIYGGIAIVALAIVFVIRGGVGKPKPGSGRQSSFIRGFGYLASNDIDGALRELKDVALREQDSVEVYITLGTLFRRKGDYSRAIHVHESAITREDLDDRMRGPLMHELVQDYRLAGRHEKAMFYLEKLYRQDKSDASLLMLAELSTEMGKLADAIKYYNRYQKITGKDMSLQVSHCYLSLAESSARDASVYWRYLKSALKAAPMSHKGRFMQMNRLFADGRPDKGIEAAEDIINDELLRSAKDVALIEDYFHKHKSVDDLYRIVAVKLSRNAHNPWFAIFAAEYMMHREDAKGAAEILVNHIRQFGPVRVVAAKYAEITGDEVVSRMVEGLPLYRCGVCRTTYRTHYERCGQCKSIETVKPL